MQLILVSEDDNVTCVACVGNISQSLFTPNSEPLEDLLGQGCFARQVLMDLEKADYIDSSGIGWLIGSHRRFTAAGGRLILHSIPPMVEQVIHLLKLQTLLTIKPDQAAALALAKQAKGQA
jgi:anti-sigma B factor antagonist